MSKDNIDFKIGQLWSLIHKSSPDATVTICEIEQTTFPVPVYFVVVNGTWVPRLDTQFESSVFACTYSCLKTSTSRLLDEGVSVIDVCLHKTYILNELKNHRMSLVDIPIGNLLDIYERLETKIGPAGP